MIQKRAKKNWNKVQKKKHQDFSVPPGVISNRKDKAPREHQLRSVFTASTEESWHSVVSFKRSETGLDSLMCSIKRSSFSKVIQPEQNHTLSAISYKASSPRPSTVPTVFSASSAAHRIASFFNSSSDKGKLLITIPILH